MWDRSRAPRLLTALWLCLVPCEAATPPAAEPPAGDVGPAVAPPAATPPGSPPAAAGPMPGTAEYREMVRREAEALILEDLLPAGLPPIEPLSAPTATAPAREPPPAGSAPDLVAQFEETRRAVQELVEREEMRDLDSRLDAATNGLKYANRKDMILWLARKSPDVADRVDLRKLAEASHNHEKRRLDDYAAEQIRLRDEALRAKPNPPVTPGAPAGVPVEGEKVTTRNAAGIIQQLIRSTFGGG